MANVIDFLENKGFLVDGKPDLRRVRSAKLTRLIDAADEAFDLTAHTKVHPNPSLFAHTASLALGGGRQPCSSLDCRLAKANELLQFAAFYSEKVYIRNLMQDHLGSATAGRDNAEIRKDFADDLILLSHLAPLIRVGLIDLVSFSYCPHCLSIRALQRVAPNEYEKACKRLARRYYGEVVYSVEARRDELCIWAKGPDDLIPHGEGGFIHLDARSVISALPPEISEKVRAGGRTLLSQNQARRIKAGNHPLDEVLHSIAFELGGAHFMRTAYLSDRELEVNFIRDLSRDPAAIRRDALMQKYLNCLVPFLGSVNPIELLRLRQQEHEAFLLFRIALSKAVQEYRTHGLTFTERDAQGVFSDILEPRLAALDAKVKSARRVFRKETLRQALGWVGSISAGLYAGFITSNVLTGAASFGAARIVADALASTMAKSDVKEPIRKDEMYFLWRVRELAARKTRG